MKKIAIIGASYLQEPLIIKARKLGIETHVFAWSANDIGEKIADCFYPISITERKLILEECQKIGVDGICSIASDLAVGTVNYVANEMGLIGNSLKSSEISTNKYLMKRAFNSHGVPTPTSVQVESVSDIDVSSITFPIIVKPLDRSGSRGITQLFSAYGLSDAIDKAKSYGFIKKALVEEFAEGQEYSVECISWKGKHELLAVTRKYTSGTPSFIETGHVEPSGLDPDYTKRVKRIVFQALDSLEIEYGASHSELKIDKSGNIRIIEIGARGGGDCICGSLVELSTGIDFVKAVIDVALGERPDIKSKYEKAAAVRYILSQGDYDEFCLLRSSHPDIIKQSSIGSEFNSTVTDSSSRHGYYVMQADSADLLIPYMPLL